MSCGFAKGNLRYCFGTTGQNQCALEAKQHCNNGIRFTRLYRQNQLVVYFQIVFWLVFFAELNIHTELVI